MKPFLFLDVDGVLNNRASFEAGVDLDTECCARLRRIIEETGCEVVLSSTWRLYPSNARRVWAVIGGRCQRTPELRGPDDCRGTEIAAFLAADPRPYVIVDDDSDMLEEQLPFFVQTDLAEGGLTEEKAQEIINKFKGF